MGYLSFLKNKKITVMGLGLLGRGVGDAEFLAQCGAEILVTDKKSEQELAPSVERLRKYPHVAFVLGEHRLEDFRSPDFVLKAAGVPLDSPYVEEARAAGVPIKMSTALFCELLPADVLTIGVTGTRGKSTTTHLIYEALQRAGTRVHLGGNVRGISTLALLPEVKEGDTVVLELDSWQLQGFGESNSSPDIAVFTNLKDDHLNYYPDKESYFNDKANIFRFQNEGDTLIAGRQVYNEWIRDAKPPVTPIVPEPLPDDWKLSLAGEHNRENAAFARAALHAAGLQDKEIRESFSSFKPIAGRLQFVREVGGVEIYNDNNATTPDATIAALRALGDETRKNIVLIMGGADKGLDMSALREEIPRYCKAVVLLAGTGTERFKNTYNAAYEASDLTDALRYAKNAAAGGDSILFSPAFASFGAFKNEYDRNDQFMNAVEAL